MLPIAKPSLLLHNVSKIDDEQLQGLVKAHNAIRIQRTFKSSDVYGDVAVVYFHSKQDAYSCLSDVKANWRSKMSNDGNAVRVSATYRDMNEPAVEINLPAEDMNENDLKKHLSDFRIQRVIMSSSGSKQQRTAVVIVSTPKEAQSLCDRVNLVKVGNFNLTARLASSLDTGIIISYSFIPLKRMTLFCVRTGVDFQ